MADTEMWVESDGFGHCRLDGNAHTFPGRISAWSETLGTWVTIDRRDIREASPEAWVWIDGFLTGSEPEFHEFLGLEPDEVDFVPQEDASWPRYQAVLEEFRQTGSLPIPLNPRPRKPPPTGLTSEPWTIAAGQVLRWDGSTWVTQQPQPELLYALLVGTACDEQQHHRMEEGDDNYAACRDCGYLSVLAVGHNP